MRTDRVSWCLVCNQLINVDDYHECLDGPEKQQKQPRRPVEDRVQLNLFKDEGSAK